MPTTGSFRILLLSLFYVSVGAWIAEWRRVNPGPSEWLAGDYVTHLGAEYDEIARAIRSGRGFSDPFREQTGPTAWMPPVLPYSLAALYYITGDSRHLVVDIYVILQLLVVFQTCVMFLAAARELKLEPLGHFLLIVSLLTNFRWLFQFTHDTCLLLLIVNLVWLGSCKLLTRDISYRRIIAWGVFGGFTALCSPVGGAVWALLVAIRLRPIRNRDDGTSQWVWPWKKLAVAAAVSMLMVAPWMLRNKIVLGKWIPVKSNAGFELWQSQCLDDDGISDFKPLSQHPYVSNGESRRRYKEIGEVAFIAEKKAEAMRAIVNQPADYLDRVANRWYVICIYYTPRFKKVGQEIPLLIKRIVFPFPFVATWVLLLCWHRVPLGGRVAACIYFVYILPYMLLGYTTRYSVPLLAIKTLLILYACHAIAEQFRRGRSAREDEGENEGEVQVASE